MHALHAWLPLAPSPSLIVVLIPSDLPPISTPPPQAYSKGSAVPEATRRRIDCFTHAQLRYILGDSGRSFVCGYGKNPPTQPHHRGASCPALDEECGWDAFNVSAVG